MSEKIALILGAGMSGLSAKKFLEQKGYLVHLIDNKTDKHLSIDLVHSADLTVVSPGVPRENSFYRLLQKHSKKFVGEAELGLVELSKNATIIGVTGTNGKTTLVHCLSYLLNAKALGNIGTPFTSYEAKKGETIISELSSFQIETLIEKTLDVAIITNITPDHLDRYKSYDEYAKTKFHITDALKKGGRFIISKDLYEKHKSCITNKEIQIVFEEDLEKGTSQLSTLCRYLTKDLLTKEEFENKMASFKKPEHRLEYVLTAQGRVFINDSKATNVESTLFGVKSILPKKHIIMGGSEKGLDYHDLIDLARENVAFVYLIGQCKEKMQTALQDKIPSAFYRDLEEAMRAAFSKAKPGEVVLLSPAAPSFDAFKNFEHRGQVFKQLASQIQKEGNVE